MKPKIYHGRLISYLNVGTKFNDALSSRGLSGAPVSENAGWDDILVVDTSNEARKWAGKVGTIVVYSNESRFAIDLPRVSNLSGTRVFNYGLHLGDFDDIWNIYANYGKPGVIEPNWSGRNTACMFASNKDSLHDQCPMDLTGARWKIAQSGTAEGLLDLYGRGWRDLRTQGEHRFGADGRDHSEIKREISSGYCVQVALENTYIRNYVTEKFWQSADAGCMPVYLGSSWLDKYVDPGLYLDLRGFRNTEDLWESVNIAVSRPAESEERVREIQDVTARLRSEARSGAAYTRWTEQLLDVIEALLDQDALSSSGWNSPIEFTGNAGYSARLRNEGA